MAIIKNNIKIAKIYRGINSIGKAYVGDKLVFGGRVTPTPASSVLVYNEASPINFDSEMNVASVT